MDEERDIHSLNKQYQKKLERLNNDDVLSKANKSIILEYLHESEIGKTIKKGQKKKIGSGRNLHAAGFLYLMSTQWFKKDLDTVTNEDMSRFILGLDRGDIKNKKGKPYTSESKGTIKKFIRKFYKWLALKKPGSINFTDLCDWIDTSIKEAEVDAFPDLMTGIKKIVDIIPTIQKKALIMVAADSGFREGELLNMRIKDAEMREDDTYYVTCRTSKTKPRTVSIALATNHLANWLKVHPHKNQPSAFLWISEWSDKTHDKNRPMTRKGITTAVKIYGERIYPGRRLTVHMLRHTSATYYAQRMDRAAFCKRYGWSYSSKQPDRYIDFSKVEERKVVETVKADQFHEMKKAQEESQVRLALQQEALTKMQQEIALMRKQQLANVLAKRKN